MELDKGHGGNDKQQVEEVQQPHPFHTESGDAIDGVALKWTQLSDDANLEYETCISSCDLCCDAYYAEKCSLDATAFAVAHRRDSARLRKALEDINQAVVANSLPVKDVRKAFTNYAYEILKYPDYLMDHGMDDEFTTALVSCQKVKLLKFKTALLPGLIVLAAHQNEFARNWALNSMAQMDSSLYTDRSHLSTIDLAVRIIVNKLLATSSSKYNLVTDPTQIWHTFAAMICCFTSDGVGALLEMFPTLDTFVCESLISSATTAPSTQEETNSFPYILSAFSKFRESVAHMPSQTPALLTNIWSTILVHPWFQTILKTTPWLSSPTSSNTTLPISDIWNAAFSWIPPVLASFHGLEVEGGDPEMTQTLLLTLLDDYETWTLHAKPEFIRLSLLPILSAVKQYQFPKILVDKICAYSLQGTTSASSTADAGDGMILHHLITECLESDVDTLEQAFQDIYRDCNGFDPTTPSSSLLHTEIWKVLGTSSTNAGGRRPAFEALFGHVFKVFGRIFLYDHVNADNAGWSSEQKSYVKSFNTGLSLVWFVVHRGLGLMDTEGEEVAGELLYCLVCRSDEISGLAKQMLMKAARTDSYSAMLQHLFQQDEKSKIETLLTILDTFRDLCTMGGPPLLGCAERIQILLSNVYEIVFQSDESYRFNETNPDLWIKSWPFISSILSSSVKWAKRDASIKRDIKAIILATFFLMKQHLLNNSNVLTSKHFIASATVPFMNTIWSIFQWYRVIDDGIREESVAVTIQVLKVAEGFRYVLDESLVGAIMQYMDGSLKSRLTDESKKVLQNWVESMYERQEAKKPKKSLGDAAATAAAIQKSVADAVGATAVRRKLSVDDTEKPNKFAKVESTAFNKEAAIKRVQALPMAPKPPTKPVPGVKPMSKLSQLRQTHIAEQRRHVQDQARSRTTATILSRADSSDTEIDYDKYKSIKMIDDGMVVDLDTHKQNLATAKAAAPVPKKKIVTRLRNMNELYKIFLKWRVDDRGNVPAGFPFDLVPIPDRFESNDDYMNVFEPLLVLECWEQFKTSVEETDFSKNFTWTLDTCMMLDEFHDVTFVQPFEDSKKRVTDSDLVYIQQQGGKAGDRKGFLGKVQKMFSRKGETTYITRIHLKNQHQIVPLLFENSKWVVTKLFSMTTVLREYESLLQLPKVALCSEVIQPLYRKKFTPKEGSVEKAMQIFGANRPQAEAIATATQRPSGFVLIQGPPGTGKTKTILSLVGSLLTSAATAISTPGGGNAIKAPGGGSAIRAPGGGTAIRAPAGRGPPSVQASRNVQPSAATKKNRLLICAPSNAACDEIVRRLKMGILNAQGKEFKPKIVRLGTSDSIGVDIRDLTIENLIKEQLAVDPEFRKVNQDVNDNSQWLALEKHQSELLKERDSLREKEQKETNSIKEADLVRNAISKVSEKLKAVDEKFKGLKQKRLEREGSSDHIRSRIKASILLDADVIMATLSGAGHEIVSTLQNFEFPTVIIDEACQSVELSSLIPLRYGAKKCILVGDPMQLPPTVLSPTAKKFGYENSLFQRIMGMYGDSVCLLSIQYRMHPNISAFPSAQFYNSRLLDAEKMDTKCVAPWHTNAEYPTYRFLNVGWGRELRERHSLYNPDEIIACVNFVAKLCKSFSQITFASRIGVITPYRMQMLKMKDKFKEKFGENVLDFVDINTIDAFQGREKDIIILSTVRAGLGEAVGFLRDKRRMNVALTRAKNSLFIVGRGVSLCNNEDWRALVEDCQARTMFVEMDRKEFGPSAKFDYSSIRNLKE
ncbi:UNVERIFIED_CONTAM: DEAD-box type RNA helicase [Siphonaria sp. JEL0065]|nr:DEAD-box type RNA helicase [Siphonaria sp. JEL0065]